MRQNVILSAMQSSMSSALGSDRVPSGHLGKMTPVPSGQKWQAEQGNW